jgi:hypothetical protein
MGNCLYDKEHLHNERNVIDVRQRWSAWHNQFELKFRWNLSTFTLVQLCHSQIGDRVQSMTSLRSGEGESAATKLYDFREAIVFGGDARIARLTWRQRSDALPLLMAQNYSKQGQTLFSALIQDPASSEIPNPQLIKPKCPQALSAAHC